ncbi:MULTISPECIES: hypothetical protein [unclassified Microbacterium]|uniref:hypothetical protein n=1 Tax=unclassified Microbacterium TaxID=2609290 RepID=UPI002469732F|nr:MULTISPECIES: hypothetical protein [unclassified Microbacterium]MDH5134322.1 hypothetical protein [Microbacterium sp. RD10]MDH5137671.1 hypothetical protein [Microbacterium sp. RD11]MDH5145511.1 hypothetical protein [Microbacterium sp. RD12]MDH5155775.1 hypothetical protein [Microbacterium sp. RD06]MDH5166442.1 hypothetical protein [Microbacterium sp. RD02]
MTIDPREQARAYEDTRVEDVPEPDVPEDRSEVRQVPEAIAAADVTKRKDTAVETAPTDEITDAAEAAEVRQKLEEHRARGIEWVRPTDLIARNTASLAGRGIDLEVEMSRKAREPLVDGLRNLGDRAKRLSPLSAFGHGVRHHAPTRAAVGKS